MTYGDPALIRTVHGRVVPNAGTYVVNHQHTYIGFSVDHLSTRVRGRFGSFAGEIVIADDPSQSSVTVTVGAASVDTGHHQVSGAAKGESLLDVERFPEITFISTAVEPHGDTWLVHGDLTVHGVTRLVDLRTTFRGAARNPYGNAVKIGLSATCDVDRRDLGLTADFPVPGAPGVLVVGTRVSIDLDIEADLTP